MLKDFTVLKVLLTAVGIGSILLFIEIQVGWASFHIKPFNLTGVMLGGCVFGIGMAVLGYCPGTLIVSMGEGAMDAFVGTIGGLMAGLVYIVLYPGIKSLLGPGLGGISLYTNSLTATSILVFLFGIILIGLAIYIDKFEAKRNARII